MSKKVRITITQTLTDELYEGAAQELKKDILSGKTQRDLLNSKGILKVAMTWETLKE